jgi:hypothetical protein
MYARDMASSDGYLTWNPEDAIEQLVLESAALEVGNPVDTAQNILKDNAGRAALAVVHMAVHSRDERIRLKAAQYVLDKVIAKNGVDDPFADLLKQMTDQ